MSVSKWRWKEICDTRPCPGDCDLCDYEDDYEEMKYIIMCGGQYTKWERPRQLLEIHGEPIIARYCCEYLKEDGGEGRDKITGVRWDESNRRKKTRSGLEVSQSEKWTTSKRERLDPDNMDEDMVRYCMQSKGFILNPIIDWTTEEVWEFIHRFNIPYCELYDQGFTRLGCIGCPMASIAERKREFELYPKYKRAYIKAFERMIQLQIEGGSFEKVKKSYMEYENGKRNQLQTEQNSSITGLETASEIAEEWFTWWLRR